MTDEPELGRRALFGRLLDKAASAGTQALKEKARRRAHRVVRPPFAVDELDFLLRCTRCDRCVEACPHGVIFALAGGSGLDMAGTPALDLLHKGCHLCEDWPCVNACPEDALLFPGPGEGAQDDPPWPASDACPPLAKAQIDPSRCLPYAGPECGACRGSCPVSGALAWQGNRPHIDPGRCAGCGLCREVCITDPKAVTIQPL